MKKQICTLIALVTTASAHAASSRDVLEASYKAQSSWKPAAAQAAFYQGDMKVLVTSESTARLAEPPSVFLSQAIIDMPAKKTFNAQSMKSWCSVMSGSYSSMKTLGNRYVLKLRLNPFAASNQISVGGQAVKIENGVLWAKYYPQFEFGPGSAVATETHADMTAFGKAITTQLEAQKSAIASTGIAQLDLTGWDDVACDIANGTTKVKFAMNFAWESPTVKREAILSPRDLETLYQGTKPMVKTASSLIGAMSLGASMATNLKRSPDSFSTEDLTSIYGQIFDPQSGAIRNLDRADFSKLTYDLDHLVRGPIVQTISLEDRVAVATHP